MKTLNIHTDSSEIFIDSATKKYTGFAGKVHIYNSEIYVDTRNGTGYDTIVKKLSKFIKYMATKYNIDGMDVEDLEQEVVVYILEGIPKYDPRKNTKLSTFLQMRTNRRLINDIRDQGRDIRNANTLSTNIISVKCSVCKNRYTMHLDKNNNIEQKKCQHCGKLLKNSKIYHISNHPQLLSSFSNSENEETMIQDLISEENCNMFFLHGSKSSLEEKVIENDRFDYIFKNVDEVSRELLKLICFEDHSIETAAKKMGINHNFAINKIKRLKNKEIIKELFKNR